MFTAVGVLTASASPLEPTRRNAKFQPGKPGTLSRVKIVNPAKATSAFNKTTWSGVKVQPIAPEAKTARKVELDGFVFLHTQEASAPLKADVKAAGGRH